MTDVEPDGNIYTYFVILSIDGNTHKIYSYNCSVNPPQMLANKTNFWSSPIVDPIITPLNSSILVSFWYNGGASVDQYSKTTLSLEYVSPSSTQREYGVYLKEYGYLISIREKLRVIDTPENSGGTVKVEYNSLTAYP